MSIIIICYLHTCRNITVSPNKVLCFTHSSPLIHQLPGQYPSSIFDVQIKQEDIHKTLKDLVFEKTDQLVVCKLCSIISQTAIHKLLKKFVYSDKTDIFVIVANMKETSRQVVNHLRILIEETEVLAPQQHKLFIFLLHFPPAQFFKPCYPSLFLHGWDHCYLDTITHSIVKGMINIRDWFWQCCFPPQPDAEQQDEGGDSLIKALNDIIPQAIPILLSRVFFGTHEGGSFSAPMTGSSRNKSLQELLFDRGVGKVVVEQFCSWYKTEMEDMLLKQFEYEFHSANYHTLVEVITGLRTVVGYLIKVCLSSLNRSCTQPLEQISLNCKNFV